MSRPLRIDFAGAWYHLLHRGAARRRIFLNDADRGRFMALLGDLRKRWKIEIHAYSLMDNHYHLLVHAPEGQLSRAMRHLNGVYTQRFNRAHGTDGALFRGRFKSILIDRDSYLQELVRYIHMNPVTSGECKVPSEHRWTSHRAYLFSKERPPWLEVDAILREFGTRYATALRRLDEFVRAGVSAYVERVYAMKKRPNMLGTDVFRDWVRTNFVHPKRDDREIPDARATCRRRVKLPEIIRFLEFAYGVGPKEISGRSSTTRNEARSMAMWLMRCTAGASHREIAVALGGIKTTAVAMALHRFDAKLRANPALEEKADAFACHILSHVKT